MGQRLAGWGWRSSPAGRWIGSQGQETDGRLEVQTFLYKLRRLLDGVEVGFVGEFESFKLTLWRGSAS